ncbi:IS200/IS605 family transposase [Carboxylicivirga marina]|uniref:IS200/IS605 family transposase n=1 Tax=Carboxylicivirga marina TaxID=2800988 RepID=A0ABS1HMD9_9BACT|nr:IS200/IS605 family transposase [Carboxylicivirga marina]MBK3518791.1 IS200/IS605 family transposase [Carboxylicivirga marina]
MSQSLSKVYIHLIFSTKHIEPLITERVRTKLQAYIVGTLSELKSYTEAIYANPDHLHILCTLPRIISIASLVSNIKSSSSKWMKTNGTPNFFWQDGYGIFSVSSSKVPIVKKYIENQKAHHQESHFKDELREFFKQYHVEYDEDYVWD